MTALVARAPGKVNLCLFVGRPRPDGLHPLVSLVQPVDLADELRLEPAPAGAAADAVVCPGVEGENLAARALALYREATGWDAPPQRLSIAKRVPVAAGMGGGSGDAAAALRLAAHAAGRPDDPVLGELAPALGADVPAQLLGQRALVEGAGERVSPLPSAGPFALVVVALDAALRTPAVYARADALGSPRAPGALPALAREVRAAARLAGVLPPALAENDLEPAARALCPEIDAALAALRAAGAEQALVSGSGPTVFGTFPALQAAKTAAAALRPVYPRALAVEPVAAGYGAPRREELVA